MSLTTVQQVKHFGGTLTKYSHESSTTQCTMRFNLFLPRAVEQHAKVPLLYCLGGLTATEDNFPQKSGFGAKAAEHGIALVFPDTSPRNVGVAEAEDDNCVGYSAGFYLNATQAPWEKNWRMYDYIVKELPQLLENNFPIDPSRTSIMGHSMGGHGALTIFLKNQDRYKSVSAFAPITNLSRSPWGLHALSRYLGEDRSTWAEYDAVELLKHLAGEKKLRNDVNFLIDQGTGDEYLNPDHLHTYDLVETVKKLGLTSQFDIRFHDGYSHGYYTISTFINDHIEHHAKALGV